MIEICNVTKSFGSETVLRDVSAVLEAGKIYGLVGKTVSHPPCGNFSPPWVLVGRYGSLMVSPGPGVCG